MQRKHLALVIGLVLVAGASVTYYVVTTRQMDQATHAAQPAELLIIQQLLEASKSKPALLEQHELKREVARGRAMRICGEAVELWASYASRCSKEGAAAQKKRRAAVREVARKTLGCQTIRRVGAGEAIDRCFDFLMTGSCDVLSYTPEALRRSLSSTRARPPDKPPPHTVCLGVF
jgi:hypothetical protein